MYKILETERELNMQPSTRFHQMLEEYGALEAAHRLLRPGREFPHETFSYLRKIGRSYLTMEYYVIQDKYQPLFSDQELEIAQWRLLYGD